MSCHTIEDGWWLVNMKRLNDDDENNDNYCKLLLLMAQASLEEPFCNEQCLSITNPYFNWWS
jgi:hypothetical protein